MGTSLLAHSARLLDGKRHRYADHILAVINGARTRANATVAYHPNASMREALVDAVVDAARFHDLGKLDQDIQSALHRGRGAKLPWDHIDAGVAHLQAKGAHMAAWLVRAHHAPGLPCTPSHFTCANDRKLRGRRNDNESFSRHREQIERTNRLLADMLAAHEIDLGHHDPAQGKVSHGINLRLGLSCLVDADHSDTAEFDGWVQPPPAQPRWTERLAALDAYVEGLSKSGGERAVQRRRFYEACRYGGPGANMVACEGPVGIGKTTAVTAYLLRRAIETRARRLFVVAPYTAVLSQTAATLRKALVLEDEQDRADSVVAEHHHRADFSAISSRDLAALWTPPVILTTAVQFFETLSSNAPSALRKLHALPGSAVFLDEAHAVLPTNLWPQNWCWLRELAEKWSCTFVFASGSLARFWEVEDIVGEAKVLPGLVPDELTEPLLHTESKRVRYISESRFDGPDPLANAVAAAPGPRLLIMNTIQNAAVMARHMKKYGHDTLHLSSALCPRDRDVILQLIRERLDPNRQYPSDWTLVSTSLMEAGVDVSFRTPFRERFSTASLIQIGGRGNRNLEWSDGVTVHDFLVSYEQGLNAHPDASVSAEVLARMFDEGKFEAVVNPAELVTYAMRRELRRYNHNGSNELLAAERERRYPEVAALGRVINTDTRLVVVDPSLRDRIAARDKMSTREILFGSVQIWAAKIALLRLDPIPGRDEIYWWPHDYDPGFIGYMAGALRLQDVAEGCAFIV